MRLALIVPVMLVVALIGVLPAAATGTLDCVAHDRTADIDVHGIVPYGMSAPLVQVQAEVKAVLPGVSPELGKATFATEHRIQFWLDDVSLNLVLYREREVTVPFGATKLVIKTTRTSSDEEGTYQGTYDIQGREVPEDGGEAIDVHVKGAIECVAG